MKNKNTRLSKIIQEALKKRLNEANPHIQIGDVFIVTQDIVVDNRDEEVTIAYKGDILKAIEDDGDGAFLFEMIEGSMEGVELSLNAEEISRYLDQQDSLDEAKDEEEEVELNDEDGELDSLEGGEDEEVNFDDEEGGEEATGDVKGLQDSLEAALEAAKQMGDEKLVDQIGNTITFFTRTHVVKERQNVNEEIKRFQKLAGIIKG